MAAHNVVRILGTLPGGEVWSVTPKFDSPAGVITEYEDLENWAADIGEIIRDMGTGNTLRNFMSTAASISGVRVEYRDANNELAQAAEDIFSESLAGSGSANKPYQCSAVISLRTGRPGRSYRGRIYWPALNVTLSTATLRIAPASVLALCTAMRDLLNGIRTAPSLPHPMNLVVVSQTRNENTTVTQLQVGDVMDIQRRRRDSLVEQVTSLDFIIE